MTLAGAIWFAAFLPGAAAAQSPGDDGPQKVQRGPLSLDQLDAYVELESNFDYSRVKSDNRFWPPQRTYTQKNRNLGFEERVGLKFDGDAWGRDIITFGGDVGFGLTQDRYHEKTPYDNRTDDDHGTLLNYDLRMNFFEGKPLSGSIYGLKTEDRINRRFLPTLDEFRTGYGTNWTYAHEKFPMELTYDYLETDRTGNRDRYDDEHYTDSTLKYNAQWIVSEHHRFNFTYEHAETKQEYQGLRESFDTTRDQLTLDQEIEFGDQHQHSLRTLTRFQDESGDFARDLFEIGPQLSLEHTENLKTLYKYQFNHERYEGLDIDTHRADWQLVHQLYENLTTTVDLFALYENVDDDVDTTQYGGSVDWQYNRKNPLGRFYGNLALGYDTERTKGGDGTRPVLDESAAFRDPLPIVLRNRRVEPGSIVVTDARNLRLYLPGIDYWVVYNGEYTLLTRVPTGRIADGDSVLIDYRYRLDANGQIDTMRVDLSLEQRFQGIEGEAAWLNGFTPYYRLGYRNQEDDHSIGFGRRADRTDHHRMGLKYEQKRYTLGGEFEVFDDAVEPYYAYHFDGLLHIYQKAEHTLDLSSRLSRFFFEGGFDDRNVTLLDLDLDHRYHLREDLTTFERLGYRWEDDSVYGITQGWDATAGVEYKMGDLSAQITIEYDRLDLPGSVEDDLGVWFRLRRDIPDVLAKW